MKVKTRESINDLLLVVIEPEVVGFNSGYCSICLEGIEVLVLLHYLES